jgi:DNA repair protein RecO (recombination protein O)
MVMKITLQPAFVLHSRPYRDTSALVEFFTRDHGRIGLIAKGVKSNKSRNRGILQPFRTLLISWTAKHELNVLSAVEETNEGYQLNGQVLVCGFYINELLMRLLHRNDPHPELFDIYSATLQALQKGNNIQRVLRLYERDLLNETGYGLQLEVDAYNSPIENDLQYSYQIEHGPVVSSNTGEESITVHGSTLLSLLKEELDDARSLAESRKLMREVLNFYLGGKPLKSREMLVSDK